MIVNRQNYLKCKSLPNTFRVQTAERRLLNFAALAPCEIHTACA